MGRVRRNHYQGMFTTIMLRLRVSFVSTSSIDQCFGHVLVDRTEGRPYNQPRPDECGALETSSPQLHGTAGWLLESLEKKSGAPGDAAGAPPGMDGILSMHFAERLLIKT
jgi:hypothetical protein